ncbi:MAG TPA: hypothetical protein VFZ79_20040, partial [Acidimicrobiales bacterium]
MTGRGPDHVRDNVAWWDARRDDQLASARRGWSAAEPAWGIFGVPESVAELLPADVDGAAAVELGCGT